MEGIISDSEKFPKLNDVGEEEIEKVCEYLTNRGVHYDKIYTSSSARCTQSAQIVAKLFKKRITTIDLPARKMGEWSGATFYDIYKQYGVESITKKPKGGEGIKEFNNRVSKVISQLVEENHGNRIIVVTTPDVVQAAIALTLNLTPENQFKSLIKTGSLTQISYFVDDWSSVIYSDYQPI
jgi:broad specificity phosphatase PhoE